ncbi:carboxypeptidase regulatory-like domain-containing protein [Candidatus Roizmanbacteria bacterium]|nr:carboxypeptidase regulatory-like domain-containing protein [Candidatus Roizmanbacteria bacterium]
MKNFFLLLFSFLFVLVNVSSAQTVDTDPTSDLKPPYVMECVSVNGQKGGWPPEVDQVTFSGVCSSDSPCDIGICEGNNCTVYDAVKDTRYFGQPGGGLPNVTVGGGTDPHKFPPGEFKDISGAISNPSDHVWYSIYAIHEPLSVARGGEGRDPSQQLSETEFQVAGSEGQCLSVYWDPYGRVFDSISLEPLGMNEAKVTLLDEAGNFVNTPSNNTPIDDLGKYNIFLEVDGKYKLKVDSMANHDFVQVTPNSLYSELYEKLYISGGPAFFESKNDPQRYDIPVKPKNTPYHREPTTIFKTQDIVWNLGQEYAKIEFRVSHPRTKIVTNLSSGWVCTQTESVYSDKEGFCTIMIKASDVPQEGVDIEYILDSKYYPLSTNPVTRLFDKIISFFVKEVKAQQSIKIEDSTSDENTVHFDPILRHVEGFAYYANKEPIPGAKINVRLLNKSIYYTATADDSGFFTIYKKNLPPLEFYLEIVDSVSGKTTIQTTSEFVKSNDSYLETEKINLMAGTKYDQPIINPKTGELNDIVKTISPTPANKVGTSNANSSRSIIMIIIFAILLLLLVTAGVIIYIKRNKFVP